MVDKNTVEICFYCEECGGEVIPRADSETNIWHIEPCPKCLKEEYLKGFNAKQKEPTNDN